MEFFNAMKRKKMESNRFLQPNKKKITRNKSKFELHRWSGVVLASYDLKLWIMGTNHLQNIFRGVIFKLVD